MDVSRIIEIIALIAFVYGALIYDKDEKKGGWICFIAICVFFLSGIILNIGYEGVVSDGSSETCYTDSARFIVCD